MTLTPFSPTPFSLDRVPLELGAHEVEIYLFVPGFEEDTLTTIATLRHVVRNAGNDHTGEASHRMQFRFLELSG